MSDELELEKLRLADRAAARAWRGELIRWIVVTLTLALPNLILSWRNGDKLQEAERARETIEVKLDEQSVSTKEAVVEAKAAVEHAKVAAEETKTAVTELRNMGQPK